MYVVCIELIEWSLYCMISYPFPQYTKQYMIFWNTAHFRLLVHFSEHSNLGLTNEKTAQTEVM